MIDTGSMHLPQWRLRRNRSSNRLTKQRLWKLVASVARLSEQNIGARRPLYISRL